MVNKKRLFKQHGKCYIGMFRNVLGCYEGIEEGRGGGGGESEVGVWPSGLSGTQGVFAVRTTGFPVILELKQPL